jgi:RNA polymerase sigma-70 factor (ECF subfamily)
MTEDEIVKRCLDRDPVAQKALYDKYSAGMMSLCLRYANHRDEAEDMLQEGFIKVFEKLHQFNGTGSVGGWIRTVMVNTALIHIRKNKKWNYSEDIEEHGSLNATEYGVLEELAAEELMALINAMPTGYKMVFNLFAIEGYSHKEIAELLEVSESTSKTQFHKAKAYLRKELDKLKRP